MLPSAIQPWCLFGWAIRHIPKFHTFLTSHTEASVGCTLQPEKESIVLCAHWIAGQMHLSGILGMVAKRKSAILGVEHHIYSPLTVTQVLSCSLLLFPMAPLSKAFSTVRTMDCEFESHLEHGCMCALIFLICNVLCMEKLCSRLLPHPRDNWWMVLNFLYMNIPCTLLLFLCLEAAKNVAE
jgi:hypothetical protein